MVQTLIRLGADIDVAGGSMLSTPLMSACVRTNEAETRADTVQLVRVLLRAGAEVNKRKRDGGTALTLALRTNRLDLMLLLFAYVCNVKVYTHTPPF